jgi:hypothetical protein
MSFLRRSANSVPKKRGFRVYYATDLHGSDPCFRKFLAAGRVFDADAIIMGGDMTGKAIVPIRDLGRGRYEAEFQGERETGGSDDLQRLKRRIIFNGFYPWVADDAAIKRAEQDDEYVAAIFEEFMVEQVRRWTELAADRLADRPRAASSLPATTTYLPSTTCWRKPSASSSRTRKW